MNILIYIPAMYYCEYPFYMEIIQRHINNNDSIKILRCNRTLRPICNIAELTSCFAGVDTSCDTCDAIFNKMISFLNFPHKNILFTDFEIEMRHGLKGVHSTEDFLEKMHKNYDYGKGIVNTIACGLNEYNPDMKKYHAIMDSLANVSIALYDHVTSVLQKYAIDMVYMFNGRVAINRPVLRAAQFLGVEAICLEYAHQRNKFNQFINTYPQDLAFRAAAYQKIWDDGPENKGKLGERYFNEHRQKTAFTNLQINNKLPYSFDSSKKNIVIYNSTLSEIYGIDEYMHSDLVPNLNSTLVTAAIAIKLLPDENYHIYLRAHPNSKLGYNRQLEDLRDLYSLKLPNMTIIWPEESVDTYALMLVADRVVTFGSTMGPESTASGKISICIGESFYDWADVTYAPQSFQELLHLLKSNIPPKPRENAWKVGYCLNEFGVPFQYFDPVHGTFCGKPLEKKRFPLWVSKTKHLVTEFFIKHICQDMQKQIQSLEQKIKKMEVEQRLLWYTSEISPSRTESFRVQISCYLEKHLGTPDQ